MQQVANPLYVFETAISLQGICRLGMNVGSQLASFLKDFCLQDAKEFEKLRR